MHIKEIKISDKNYPKSLQQIYNAPKQLFMRGNILPQDANAIAIVGPRKCTAYGKQAAYDLAYAIAKQGITIVSGMALGIDGEAHRAALDAKGRTIAVLGSGVDEKSVYPHTHKPLAEKIEKSGAVLSEYIPGTPSYPGNFPQRNRIVSGLSLGTLVVEAGQKSGALITARFALEQNKEVFAIPSPIYSHSSQGVNKLIQEGAKLVMNANDILEELNIHIKQPQQNIKEDCTVQELIIITILEREPAHTDHIITESALPSHTVLTLLTMLELKNKITRIENNIYAINIK